MLSISKCWSLIIVFLIFKLITYTDELVLKYVRKKNILIIMLSVWANVTFVEKLLGFYGSQLLLYSYGNRVSKVNCAMVGPFWLKKYETYIKYFQFLKIIFLSIRDSILLHTFFFKYLITVHIVQSFHCWWINICS